MTPATIIISSYNYAPYLRQAIDSALAQTHLATQVIVVDDGSTDGSDQILIDYGDRIHPIVKPNAGQASALNAGFASATGHVVIFLDCDDLLEHNAVASAVELMRTGASKVHWPLHQIDAEGRRSDKLIPSTQLPGGDLRNVVLDCGPRSDDYIWPPTSGNAWSKRFLDRVMPIPEASYRTCPDLYLCALAPLYGEVVTSAEPLSCWRLHGTNQTWHDSFSARLERYIKLWENCCDDLARHSRELGFSPDTRRWLELSWWHRLHRSSKALCQVIPSGSPFVLIDDDQWACNNLDGRSAFPLVAVNGRSHGAPADDAHAFRELQAHFARGIRHVVVAWQAFWWLEHYRAFSDWLHYSNTVAFRNEDLVVFDLTGVNPLG